MIFETQEWKDTFFEFVRGDGYISGVQWHEWNEKGLRVWIWVRMMSEFYDLFEWMLDEGKETHIFMDSIIIDNFDEWIVDCLTEEEVNELFPKEGGNK